jgi:hypothetical protein
MRSNNAYRVSVGLGPSAALEDAFVRRSSLFDLTVAYEDIFRYREKVVRCKRSNCARYTLKMLKGCSLPPTRCSLSYEVRSLPP